MLSRAIYSTFKKSPLDPSMGLGAYFSYRYCNTTLCGVPENYPITYALLIFEGLWAEDIKNIGFQRLLIYQYYCRHQ